MRTRASLARNLNCALWVTSPALQHPPPAPEQQPTGHIVCRVLSPRLSSILLLPRVPVWDTFLFKLSTGILLCQTKLLLHRGAHAQDHNICVCWTQRWLWVTFPFSPMLLWILPYLFPTRLWVLHIYSQPCDNVGSPTVSGDLECKLELIVHEYLGMLKSPTWNSFNFSNDLLLLLFVYYIVCHSVCGKSENNLRKAVLTSQLMGLRDQAARVVRLGDKHLSPPTHLSC